MKADCNRALINASKRGDVERLRCAMRQGADVSVAKEESDQCTALHLAARFGHLEIVDALLQEGRCLQ